MERIVYAEQMRSIDAYMINQMKIPGLLLMEQAATRMADIIMKTKEPCKVCVVCGVGNNGGDGLAIARILLIYGYDVQILMVGEKKNLTEDAKINFSLFEQLNNNVKWARNKEIICADIVVDALFGIGLSRDVEGIYADTINSINESGAIVFSADIPSGICADSGKVLNVAVAANMTVTFQYAKTGHFLYPGKEYIGKLHTVKIGIDNGFSHDNNTWLHTNCNNMLKKRNPNTNKGDYGKLLIISGSVGMAGAAVLCASSSIKTGTGLTCVASVGEVVDIVQQAVPEATCKILHAQDGKISAENVSYINSISKDYSAIAIGPGMCACEGTKAILTDLILNYEGCLIIDADAINVLENTGRLLLKKVGNIILTPHPKEFSRISGYSIEEILANPIKTAKEFSEKHGVTLLLKGATTIVCENGGDVHLLDVGTPGMAKGGSGDVLTGIISSLCAQQSHSYVDATVLGGIIAGNAGCLADEKYGDYSMSPQDTIKEISNVIKSVAYL